MSWAWVRKHFLFFFIFGLAVFCALTGDNEAARYLILLALLVNIDDRLDDLQKEKSEH